VRTRRKRIRTPHRGGFFADADLLNRITPEKLQEHVDKVAAEGRRWVIAVPEQAQATVTAFPSNGGGTSCLRSARDRPCHRRRHQKALDLASTSR
jgi:hypothetical protein